MAQGTGVSDTFQSFIFCDKDFVLSVDWRNYNKSKFDHHLESIWQSKESLFRYKLVIDESKILPGNHEFFAQLNINRAVNRRPPEDIQFIRQPFSSEKFNFLKIDPREIMFSVAKDDMGSDSKKDFFIINVSPLEHCNSLLCPGLNECFNQIVTNESLHTAMNVLLLSGTPEIRVGFNSLCGYASVNHLHYHIYYLKTPMKLESIRVERLAGRCHVLEDFPSKGFVFELKSSSDIPILVNDVYRLTSFLTDENIAHNLYMSRGLSFERSNHGEVTTERDVVRVFVWARVSSCGAKSVEAFNPALCELFGHLAVKSRESYDSLNEEFVTEILQSITEEPFMRIKDRVKQLFITGQRLSCLKVENKKKLFC